MFDSSTVETTKRVILIGSDNSSFIKHLINQMEEVPVEACEFSQAGSGDCQTDHGERTNYKLRDQPFYMRGRNGKMRGY